MVQRSSPVISVRSTPISIHLMLWFNIEPITPDNINNPISIHLMLWFNYVNNFNSIPEAEFQYILCCGSTSLVLLCYYYLGGFQYILCCGSTWPLVYISPIYIISIHLMLWFNDFCYIIKILLLCYFNTSYVVVQR